MLPIFYAKGTSVWRVAVLHCTMVAAGSLSHKPHTCHWSVFVFQRRECLDTEMADATEEHQ